MKLVIFEPENFHNFYPVAYLRPTFELRCGHSLLYEKIMRNLFLPRLPGGNLCLPGA